MAEVTYVFGDLYTNEVITEIPIYGSTSMTYQFGGGELRCNIQFDQTGLDNQLLADATIPARNFVVVERNGVVIWGGYLQNSTYQSQAKSCQLYARAFETYPARRILRENVNYVDQDQVAIFRDLWTKMLVDPNSIQFNLFSSYESGINKSLEAFTHDFKYYSELFEEIGDGINGFDWRVINSRLDGIYQREIVVGYPTLGAPDPTGLTFDYPGNILNYWLNEAVTGGGTHIYGLGAGTDNAIITSEFIHTDLVNSGFPRYDTDVGLKDINNQANLDSVTAQEAQKLKLPMPIYTIEVKADMEPVFGSYNIGDACQLVIDDPKHPQGFVRNTRIIAMEYYPPSDESVEFVRLNFEGDKDIG